MEGSILVIHVPLTAEQIKEAKRLFTEIVVPVLAQEHQDDPECEERNGASLNIRNPSNVELCHIRGGEAQAEKFHGYDDNARDKNHGIHENPEHRTSWEIHLGDTSCKPYPGGIRSEYDDRIAISGFSWQRDTIGSLWIAYRLKRIVLSEAFIIAKICGLAEDFKRLFFKFQQTHSSAEAA